MKKILSWLLPLTLLFFIAGACSSPVPAEQANASGTLVCTIHNATALTRTLVPTTDMNVSTFEVNGAGPAAAVFSRTGITPDTPQIAIESLAKGSWTITVNALNAASEIIGTGSGVVEINTGVTALLTVTVRPIDGTGNLALSVTWPVEEITTPNLTATLTAAGSATAINPTIDIIGNTANISRGTLADGYYLLNMTLSDAAGNANWYFIEAVRILAATDTSSSINLTVDDLYDTSLPSLDLSIESDLQNPIGITFTGNQPEILVGADMTISASVSEPVDTYQWYLNNAPVAGATTSSLTIGSALAKGVYSIFLVVTKADIISSSGINLLVTENPGTGSHDAPVHNASNVVLVKDMDMDENQIAGTVNIQRAFNESDVDGYALYWGRSATEKITSSSHIASFTADGASKSHTFSANTAVPAGATHLLVYSYQGSTEIATPTYHDISDRVVATIQDTASIGESIVFQNKLYFSGKLSDSTGTELLVCDENMNVSVLMDINPGTESSNPSDFVIYNDVLYFSADEGTALGKTGRELWRFDGHGVLEVAADIVTGSASSSPQYLTIYDNTIFFSATHPDYGTELWKFDGTNASLVADIYPGKYSSSYPTYLVVTYGRLYFAAEATSSYGKELYFYNGISVNIAEDINSGTYDTYPAYLTVYDGTIYFRGYDSSKYRTMYYTPSTDQNSYYTINPSASSSPASFTVFKDKLYFAATDDVNGRELYALFGESAPAEVANINPAGDSAPKNLVEYNNKLYFSADDGSNGRELWSYDGDSIIELVFDDGSAVGGYEPSNMTSFNNTLIFHSDSLNKIMMFYEK